MRNSLIVKLMGAFLILIIVSALIISVSTSIQIKHAFVNYSSENRKQYSNRLAESLVSYYNANSGWSGIDALLDSVPAEKGSIEGTGREGSRHAMGMGMMKDESSQRILLADEKRTVLYDSSRELTGKLLPDEEAQSGIKLTSGDKSIGFLMVYSEAMGVGTPAAEFFKSVNHSIVLSVLVSLAIAIVLGAILFNQVTSPLRQLKKAADAVGKGNLKERVSIRSHDEFADVGRSFNQMAESLEMAEQARLHYMADIAHELRTPLTAIQGTVEAMQDKILPLDEEQLENLHSQADLLNRLVNDLRLLSLAETGHLKLDLKPVNPGTLTRQIVEGMKTLAAPKKIILQADIPDQCVEIMLDTDRYAQILNNLITNAIRYTPEQGTIIINLRQPGKGLVVSVSDNGSGIPADDLPHVFDRFYRADKSRSRASGGAGLGLAIVRQLVEAHGGEISVTSPAGESGKGTRFEIRMPARKD